MNRRSVVLLSAGILVLLLAGCTSLEDLIRKPEVSVVRVVPTMADFQHIELEMELLVKNPNPIGISLEAYDYDLTIDGASLIKGRIDEKVNLEPEGSSIFKVPLSLNYKELYSSVKSLGDDTESAYEIATTFYFLLPVLGEQQLNLSHEGTIPVIRVPRISLASLEVSRLNLTGADIRAGLKISNPNGFDYTLKYMNAGLEVNDISWAQLAQSSPVLVPAGQDAELSYDFSLDFINMGRLVYKLIKGEDAVSYGLNGNLQLGSSLPYLGEMDMPLDLSGAIDLKR